jgi:hypothetical protein
VALYERLATAVRDTPGVENAALTNHVPLSGAWMPSRIVVEGSDPDSGGDVLFRTVSPEYFSTMRIRLEAGRAFAPSDLAGSDALMVNATLAARYWPGGSALGRRLTVFKSVQGREDFGEPVTGTVVGVIHDVRHVGLDRQVAPEVYLPYTVNPPTWISIVARGSAASGALMPAIQRRLLDIEPQLPMEGAIASVQERIGTALAARGFTARVMSSLTIPALLLTVIGIWGVIAFAVLHRRREMGIRLALGATPSGLPLTIIRHSLPWIGAGLVAGAGGAMLLGRATAGLLFGVASTDLTTLAIGAAVVAVVSFLAAWLPAREASRVDPVQVLRAE